MPLLLFGKDEYTGPACIYLGLMNIPLLNFLLFDYVGNFEADVEAILPKLQCPDYYIKTPVEELAAKELAEPGFCRRVAEFVVGREGYGSIRF